MSLEAVNCPACGAAVKNRSLNHCAYCGVSLRPVQEKEQAEVQQRNPAKATPDGPDDELNKERQKLTRIISLAGSLLMVMVAFVVINTVEDSSFSCSSVNLGSGYTNVERKDSKGNRVSPCYPEKCKPVPAGLKGLQFGMYYNQALKVFPELKIARRVKAEQVSQYNDGNHEIVKEVAGRFYETRTTIADLYAVCTLAFLTDRGFSKMHCRLNSLYSKEPFRELEKKFVNRFNRLYGQGRLVDNPDLSMYIRGQGRELVQHMLRANKRIYRWQDSNAVLLLTAEDNTSDQATASKENESWLEVTNYAPKYQAAIDELQGKLSDEIIQQQKAKEAAAMKQKEQEASEVKKFNSASDL